jgi:hypothetical protein
MVLAAGANSGFRQFYRLCVCSTADSRETISSSTQRESLLFAGDYVCVSRTPDCIEISLAASKFRGPVYEKRLTPALRFFKRKMGKFGTSVIEATPHIATLPFAIKRPRDAMTKVRAVDLRLVDIAEEPLPPRLVEKCLGISSRERLRWMKDGRLPACERRRSGRGANVFSIPFYSASVINHLSGQPEIISGWRHDDTLATAI